MARTTARPGRTLVAFFAGVAILFGLVALGGSWKPALGLDLEGGTRITLIAKGNPSAQSLDEARQIIDDRVNGSGVSEAEVTTQGNNFITVEIPGASRRDLIDTVKRQAQLRFRLVACSTVDGKCGAPAAASGNGLTTDPTAVPSDSAVSGTGTGTNDGKNSGKNAGKNTDKKTGGTAKNRPPVAFGLKSADPTASPSTSPSASASASPSADPSTDPSASPSASTAPAVTPEEQKLIDACVAAAPNDPNIKDALAYYKAPTEACKTAFNSFTCPPNGARAMEDNPDLPLITCDADGIAYLLTPAAIEGTELSDASAAIPQGQVQWSVQLSFDGSGTSTFGKITSALAGTGDQFAIVLDGQVLSPPTVEGAILDGNAQITGSFTQSEAQSLATSLKYGSLPIAFEEPSTVTVGPSLAGDQLSAGIAAGIAGLALVALYCLLYYRGLGLVVLSSLLVAAAITYAMVLLLGVSAGFTLTLPGIAGLIIAVGITADSFIIFFERIRDEMREGKSMRVAVESGWQRARVTRLAANVVSLLSASVLYIFATGVVKGFGFALGLSTVIDLAVLFWFTKPAVSYLARFRFFNGGGKLSGLSPETLGMDGVAVAPSGASLSSKLRAGGKA